MGMTPGANNYRRAEINVTPLIDVLLVLIIISWSLRRSLQPGWIRWCRKQPRSTGRGPPQGKTS